jgi:hypothetical protein
MRKRTRKLLGSGLILLIAAGCSEDPVESAHDPEVSISLESNSISVARGQTKTFPVSVTRTGGFTGTVVISVTGLPQGLSAGCSPSAVLGSSTILTVAAGPAQSLGEFTATVKATGSGVPSRTILLTITVTS